MNPLSLLRIFWIFLPFARLSYSKDFSSDPWNQGDRVGEIADAPQQDVGASLVVGVSTSAIPSGSTPPPADKIKLVQENMNFVQVRVSECQRLLAVSNHSIEYLIL